MATMLLGPDVLRLKGRISGSFFSRSKHGTVLKSNNWSKRGHTWRAYQERAQFSALSSQWRGLTQEEKATWGGTTTIPTKGFYGDFNPGLYPPGDNYGANIFKMLNSMKQTKGKAIKKKTSYYPSTNKWNNVSSMTGLAVDPLYPYNMECYATSPIGYDISFTIWAGPFTPVWKKINTLSFKCIYVSGAEPYPFPNLFFQDYYIDAYGPIPPDPGWIYLGCQILGYHKFAGYNNYTGPLGWTTAPFNGAPPYKGT